jgi:uncharacterized protein
MKTSNEDYYVYVYIDPRNFEDFYYGKGKGNRKESHLKDSSDSEKTQRIKAIQKVGLHPIIRVIAKDLTEREAFLIEKTLIWKLGGTLTNKSSGHFANKFRPHYTLYRDDLPEFDFKNGVYYINVGEGGGCRLWEECIKYGYLAAGQDKKWSDQMRTLNKGDIVIAYLKGSGFVGVGKVMETAVPSREFTYKNKLLSEYGIQSTDIFKNKDSDEMCDYLVKVNWVKTVPKEEAKWKPKSGLFTTQLIKASLDAQPKTLEFIQAEFQVNFQKI